MTELRAAVHNAADGKRLNADPLACSAPSWRACSARSGCTTEARAEGAAVWRNSRSQPRPANPATTEDPGTLEIRAAVLRGDRRRPARRASPTPAGSSCLPSDRSARRPNPDRSPGSATGGSAARMPVPGADRPGRVDDRRLEAAPRSVADGARRTRRAAVRPLRLAILLEASGQRIGAEASGRRWRPGVSWRAEVEVALTATDHGHARRHGDTDQSMDRQDRAGRPLQRRPGAVPRLSGPAGPAGGRTRGCATRSTSRGSSSRRSWRPTRDWGSSRTGLGPTRRPRRGCGRS